jgi:hypothetical protein
VLFVIVFELYHVGERHRREITKLSQEIALLRLDKDKGVEKNEKDQRKKL